LQNTCTNFCTTIAAAINPDCKDVHILRGYLNNADEASSIHTTEQTSFTKGVVIYIIVKSFLRRNVLFVRYACS